MATSQSNSFQIAITDAGPYWPAQDPAGYLPAVRNRNPAAAGVVAAGRGFGMDTRHAYVDWNVGAQTGTAPSVLHVTNRNPTGAGSFHQAFEVETGPRVIVFDLGGVFTFDQWLSPASGKVWVAGQTAPELVWFQTEGNHKFMVDANDADVFIQHCAFWQNKPLDGVNQDVFEVYGSGGNTPNHVVLDHCFFGGGTDEVLSFDNCDSVTLVDSMVCKPRNWTGDSNHAYGGIVGGSNLSLVGNLYAHVRQRPPIWKAESGSICNHLIYNSASTLQLSDPSQGSGGVSFSNFEGVASVEGPDSTQWTLGFVVPLFSSYGAGAQIHVNDSRHVFLDGSERTIADEWDVVQDVTGMNWEASLRVNSRIASAWPVGLVAAPNRAMTKEDYISLLTRNIGPRPAERISFIQTIIDEVSTRTGGIQDDYTPPALPSTTAAFVPVSNPHQESATDPGRTNLEVQLLALGEALLA